MRQGIWQKLRGGHGENWLMSERGTTTERVIFDWKRTLYDPETAQLADGALDVLHGLRERGVDLVLIGKGGDDMQQAVDDLSVRDLFSTVRFVAKKDCDLFREYLSNRSPEAVVAVGDRAHGEIAIAKSLAMRAVWLCDGPFRHELPLPGLLPDATIYAIRDLVID